MKLFPELELIESKPDRERVFSEAYAQVRRRSSFLIALIGGCVLLSVVLNLVLVVLARYWPLSTPVRAAIAGAVMAIMASFFTQYAFRRPTQRLIRTRLVEMGIPICIECGYDLRGQQNARCPECGTPSEAVPQRPRTSENG